MSAEYILYGLLALTVVTSLVTAHYAAAVQGALKIKFGNGALIYLTLASLASVTLWVCLAIATGYWQFAAMSAASFLINRGASAANKGSKR